MSIYALHAPEVECIGKGKARAPCEFGCKVSVVTPVNLTQVRPVRAPCHRAPRQPLRWTHSLGPAIAAATVLSGVEPKRIHVDKGYRGHDHPNRFMVWISGQVRRTTKTLRREGKCGAAIGHVKAELRMGRNYLKGRKGDRINVLLAATAYNYSLLIRWFAALWHAYIAPALDTASGGSSCHKFNPRGGSSQATI